MTSLIHFSSLDEFEEFRIGEREHIAAMLRQVEREGAAVYLFFADETPAQTRLVGIEEAAGFLVLAYAPSIAAARRILTSGIFVVIDFAQTQIQFHIDAIAQRLGGEGGDFLIEIPTTLYLIQRRASRRVAIPTADAITCSLKIDSRQVDLPVLDLSLEGLALLDERRELQLQQGTALPSARLTLPGSQVTVDLDLANTFTLYLPQLGRRVCRLGCRFIDLTPAARLALEQYLQGLAAAV